MPTAAHEEYVDRLRETRPVTGAARTTLRVRPVLWGALLIAVYLASRLYAMTHIPIFIDEAVHVDWARGTPESALPPDPGFEGKWLTIKLFALVTALPLPINDLIAARLITIALGLTAALAYYLFARDLFSPHAGVMSVGLYVVLPFTVIYTSLAMTDGIQVAFSAWAIFLAVRLARSSHWIYTVMLPLVLGAAILAKLSALMLIALPVMAILLLTPRMQWVDAGLRAVPALLTPLGLAALFYHYGALRIVQEKMITDPVALCNQVLANLAMAGSWLWGLLTPSIAMLAVVSVAWLLVRERRRNGLFVVALLGITILPYVVIAQTWYPRYLLAAVIPVVLAVSGFLARAAAAVQQRWRGPHLLVATILPLGMLVVLGWPILRSGTVLLALPQADIPAAEHVQFVTGWTAGYGVRELAAFLQVQGTTTPGGVNVARLDQWEHPLLSLNIYLTPSSVLSLYTINHNDPESALLIARLSAIRRTLLVLSTEHGVPRRMTEAVAPLLTCSTVIWSYTRPHGATGLVVYELTCGQ